MMFGVDLAGCSLGDVDWTQVRASGRTFAYISASTGVRASSGFTRAWSAMRMAGMPRGASHTLVDDEPAAAQAVQFLKLVELRHGDLPPVLDVTQLGAQARWRHRSAIQTWASIVESEIEARHGRALRTILRADGAGCAQLEHRALAHHPVWVIDHECFDRPWTPSGLGEDQWWIHQYAPVTAGLPGAAGGCQLDRFNPMKLGDEGGRVAQLKRRLLETAFQVGVTDGAEFDRSTRDAIVRVQAACGLLQDGIVGPKTFAQLEWL